MNKFKLYLATAILWCVAASPLLAQQYQMPQDNWIYGGLSISGGYKSLATGPDDNLYAATSDGSVAVFNHNGGLIRQIGTNLNIRGIALDSRTNVYVLTADTNHVFKFAFDGVLIRTFAGDGTNADQVIPTGTTCGITVGTGDRVYIADTGNRRVQVYDKDGNYLFHWGEYAGAAGGVLGRFSSIVGVVALPNGDIVARNFWLDNVGFHEIQLFDSDGHPLAIKFVGQELANENRDPNVIVTTPDGLLAITRSRNDSGSLIDFIHFFQGGSSGSSVLSTISVRTIRPDNASQAPLCMAFDKRGTMYVCYNYTFGGGSIYSARRYFTPNKYGTNAPPLPYILSAKQRTNSTLVDIDYRVVDGDNTNVTTGLLAFVNNGNDFASLRKPTAFVENTASNIGTNIPANTDLRLTFDASELSTNFANLQFEVLAKDNSRLLAFEFITVTNQGQADLTMSRMAVSSSEFYSLWLWLIATSDPSIAFANGVVKGVGGVYDQQTLASDAGTTSQGVANLYERLNVRAPTPDEITRAQSGSYGFISIGGGNVVKLP